MSESIPMRMRSLPLRTLVPSVVLGCGFLLSSCNGDNDSLPLVGSGPGSIQRLNAPASRSVSVVGQLNQYRAQAYSVLTATSKDVNHSNVLYTAAYRHSVWLNTVNSATYDPTTLTGIEGTTVTASSSTDQLRAEIAATTTTTSYFPALKTAKDPWNRVNAVVGGSDLLKQLVNKGIKEYFLFDGDIEIDTTTTGTGTGSSNTGEHLRGYSLGSTNLIDNLWYSRKGRLALVRPNLTAIGLAQVEDASPSGSPIIPPWPFLNGRFTGSVMCAYARPEQQQLTVWPKDGSTGIKTVGLDTDLLEVVNIGDSGLTEDEVVGHAYAGPPISVTLPVNVPFLLNSTINAGGVTVGFRKLEIDPETTLPQTPPAVVSPYVAVFFAVPTTGGTAEDVVFGAVNQATDARYQYTVVGTTVTTTATTTTGTAQDDAIHNGELIVVPTCPLESGSWYEVAVRLRTSSSAPWDEFPGTQEAGLEGTSSNNDGYYQFRFKTQ